MSLTFNGDAARDRALEDGAERLLEAATFFQTQQMQRINRMNIRGDVHVSFVAYKGTKKQRQVDFTAKGYTTTSKPGEYPRKRTGFAQANVLLSAKNIQEVIDQGMTVKAGVASNAAYLLILEFYRDRKGFLDTMKDLQPQIKAILQ